MSAFATTRLSTASLLFLALPIASAGCGNGGDPGGGGACEAALLPGDVVISEVMANPEGQSEGNEWFELYNATSEPIDLAGTELVSGGGSRHVISNLVVEPGDYVVAGGVLPDFTEEYHDYAYGDELGSLSNSGADLAIHCGDEVIDSVTYPAMEAGIAMGLDGAITPDHIANDDIGNWCEAEQTFDDDGSRGTPGAPNDSCGAALEDSCIEDGSERELIPPEKGDLVISELMARTDADISFREGEWFEVYVKNDVDLNGLQLGQYRHETDEDPGPEPVGHTITAGDCLHYEAGSRVVFARSDDPDLNGGLPGVDHEFAFGQFGLTGEDGGVYVGYDDEIYDHVSWESPWSSEKRRGVGLGLDPAHLDPEENDNLDNWCFAAEPDEFSPYGTGTPGLSNPACTNGGPCAGENGEIRDIVLPEPGDLVIAEAMPNTQEGISFRDGEWFEVYVENDVDLNTLQLGKYRPDEEEPADPVAQTLVARDCQRVPAGSRVVFARSDDPDLNTDPPLDYVFKGFGLTQSNGGVYLTVGENIEDPLEVATWTSSRDGTALNLDPAFRDPEGSSDESNWCDADEVYFGCVLAEDDQENVFCESVVENPDCGAQDTACSFGTPGAENRSCT